MQRALLDFGEECWCGFFWYSVSIHIKGNFQSCKIHAVNKDVIILMGKLWCHSPQSLLHKNSVELDLSLFCNVFSRFRFNLTIFYNKQSLQEKNSFKKIILRQIKFFWSFITHALFKNYESYSKLVAFAQNSSSQPAKKPVNVTGSFSCLTWTIGVPERERFQNSFFLRCFKFTFTPGGIRGKILFRRFKSLLLLILKK